MRSRAAALTVVLIAVVAGATRGDAAPTRQWAIVYLAEPTMIGSTIVQGPVLFVHDDDRMARGEACTTVRLFEPGKGPKEEIAEFHCTPVARARARVFTVRTTPNEDTGLGCVLTEYQFAGDTEGHKVPTRAHLN